MSANILFITNIFDITENATCIQTVESVQLRAEKSCDKNNI